MKKKTKIPFDIIIIFVLLFTAVLLRFMYTYVLSSVYLKEMFSVMRSIIFISVFILWCTDVSRRIIHKPTRLFLILISALSVFWIFIRSFKYHISGNDADIARICWYFYYLPMLLIPPAAFMASGCIGRPETYLPKKAEYISAAVSSALFLLVLTNDMHFKVFSFTSNVHTDKNCVYGTGYWIIVSWIAICGVSSIVKILIRCRGYKKKRYNNLPFIPIVILAVYSLGYYLRFKPLIFLFPDYTPVFCLCVIAVFEICIRIGFIQSNSEYSAIFASSTIGARITDENFNTVYVSANAPDVSCDDLRRASVGCVRFDGGMRLLASAIDGGYVMWQDDVSELVGAIHSLNEAKESLADSNLILEENYRTLFKIQSLNQQNKLYDAMQTQTRCEIETVNALFDKFSTADENSKRVILGKITVVGAYIKRRCNLMLIGFQNGKTDVNELKLCLSESLSNLSVCNKENSMSFDASGFYDIEELEFIYDAFEKTIETVFESMNVIFVRVVSIRGVLEADFEIESEKEIKAIPFDGCTVFCEDDGIYRVHAKRGDGI